MQSTVSAYLSPPADFATSEADISVATTIDPQKLNATPDSAGLEAIVLQDNVMSDSSTTSIVPKLEHEDDYGFSKFAAERDAAREEMDLDEDTRLLMSDEGKKLSSKERRQLRNKVSARNFRERRKEYITHLESLVSKHQNEAIQYKSQAEVLKVEKDELALELSRLKISISAAFESNKLSQQQSGMLPGQTSLNKSISRGSTPTREISLIPSLTKDINPYSANTNFNVDWPLSSMASPSNGSFDFNLHNYTSVFSAGAALPAPFLSEKELLGKHRSCESSTAGECLDAFDDILSSILGSNWNTTPKQDSLPSS